MTVPTIFMFNTKKVFYTIYTFQYLQKGGRYFYRELNSLGHSRISITNKGKATNDGKKCIEA